MYILTVVFGHQATSWMFSFKTEEGAKSALDTITDQTDPSDCPVVIKDDFGKSATFVFTDINAVLIDNTDMSNEALIEQNLEHARLQAKFQQRVQSDPAMRTAMAMAGMATTGHHTSPIVMPGGRG